MPQAFKARLNVVEICHQRFELSTGQIFLSQLLNRSFQPMGFFTESQCARQSSASFEGMQDPQRLAPCPCIVRACRPLPKCAPQLGKQFQGFFFKYREEIRIK